MEDVLDHAAVEGNVGVQNIRTFRNTEIQFFKTLLRQLLKKIISNYNDDEPTSF